MNRIRTFAITLSLLLATTTAGPAWADGSGGLLVGAKVGAGFGQVMSPFGTAFIPELEVGYALPMGLAFTVSAQYAAPTTTGTAPKDARLPGSGVMSYTLTQNQLILSLAAMYRLDVGSKTFRPYAAIGPRLYLMRTDIVASGGGQDYGKNAETSTQVGVLVEAGTEIALGPGALTAELQLGYASVDQTVLQKTSVGSLNVVVGYRVMF